MSKAEFKSEQSVRLNLKVKFVLDFWCHEKKKTSYVCMINLVLIIIFLKNN